MPTRDAHLLASRRQFLAGGALLGSGALSAAVARADAIAVCGDDPGPLPIAVPEQAPAREGVAELADTKLRYWDTGGKGEAVVLFHPATGSADIWSYQQPVLAKAGYRVIGYSRRGHSGSAALSKENPGTAAADLQGLLKILGIDKFHAVASAAGAFVAADFAISYPQRVRSLVIACSLLGQTQGEFAAAINKLRPEGFNQMPASFRELSPSYRIADPRGSELWETLERSSLVGERVAQPLINKIALPKLAELKKPVLLIAGDADLYSPPPLMRAFQRQLPGSQLAVFQECGHSAYWERPELFNKTVLEFLGQVAKS